MTVGETLRSRQADVARDSIVSAAAGRLQREDPDSLSLAYVASDAGVSLRTLYRYFPTRDELLATAGERLFARLGVPVRIEDPTDVSGSFLAASARLAGHPELARNLVRTTAGRQVRASTRRERVQAVEAAVAAVAGERLSPEAVRAAGAVVAYLCSSASWVTVCDESDLAVNEARAAVAWAIDTLIDAVHKGDGPAPVPSHRKEPK
jgi:AcrR family transcriptional regulator